jgi:hypothetical protein
MGVNLPELNQQIREQRYMRKSGLKGEYKDAMASGNEKKMDDWMTKLQQRNFDHTNTGQRYGTKIADLLAAQGKEKVMNYLADKKPDRNKMVSDLFADMKKEYSGNPKYYLKTLEEQMALRHARQNELAKIGVDETRADADKTKADADAFGDLRKGTQWFTYDEDANKNYGLPNGYTIGQGGNTATNKAGDVLHLRQDSKDNKFWAKEEDANLQWQAKIKEAEAKIKDAIAAKAKGDGELFVKILNEMNDQRASMVNQLGKYLGIDDIYDLKKIVAAESMGKTGADLQTLEQKYGTEATIIIEQIKYLDERISRNFTAAEMAGLGLDNLIDAFTVKGDKDRGMARNDDRRDFYNKRKND